MISSICTKTGKVKHSSKQAAIIAQKRVKNCLLNVYKCKSCNGWHLGNSNSLARHANRIDELLHQHDQKLSRKRLK